MERGSLEFLRCVRNALVWDFVIECVVSSWRLRLFVSLFVLGASFSTLSREQALPILRRVASSGMFEPNGPVQRMLVEPTLGPPARSDLLHATHDFCLAALHVCTLLAPNFLPLFTSLSRAWLLPPSGAGPTSATPDCPPRALSALLSVAEACAGNSRSVTLGINWQYVPRCPTAPEVFPPGAPPSPFDQLPVVQNTYPSPAAYMDTYFRLSRADAFGDLLARVHALREGAVSPAHSGAVVETRLLGVVVPDKPFQPFGLQLSLAGLDVSVAYLASRLSFGSLCCVVTGEGARQQCFFATVAHADKRAGAVVVAVFSRTQALGSSEDDPESVAAPSESELDPVVALAGAAARGARTVLILSSNYHLLSRAVLTNMQHMGSEGLGRRATQNACN